MAGRQLIALSLCEAGILQQPALYLSHYLKARRAEYYQRLQAVRDEGAWEDWLEFLGTRPQEEEWQCLRNRVWD